MQNKIIKELFRPLRQLAKVIRRFVYRHILGYSKKQLRGDDRLYIANKKSAKELFRREDKRHSDIYGKEFYDGLMTGSIRSAEEVLPFVVNLVKPQSVCDVGCGSGTWLMTIQKLAGINNSDVVGFDFDVPAESLLIEPSSYRTTDLSQLVVCERKFDLCMSLEVAEHIPASSADTFVKFLVSLAPVVLFAAAIPGQGGANHVNEQWLNYWEERFEKHHYYGIDCLRSKFWNNDKVEWWYRQNTVLFVQEDKLSSLGFDKYSDPLMSLVHPAAFNRASKPLSKNQEC
jgi:2-polyprenyl-3-methyl-5-hydroxy-6-metoxy-1,4-benzoquinol methylase